MIQKPSLKMSNLIVQKECGKAQTEVARNKWELRNVIFDINEIFSVTWNADKIPIKENIVWPTR